MEVKWFMIAAAIIFSGMFFAIGAGEYSKSQCHIEGIKAGLTAEAIVKTCGASR